MPRVESECSRTAKQTKEQGETLGDEYKRGNKKGGQSKEDQHERGKSLETCYSLSCSIRIERETGEPP